MQSRVTDSRYRKFSHQIIGADGQHLNTHWSLQIFHDAETRDRDIVAMVKRILPEKGKYAIERSPMGIEVFFDSETAAHMLKSEVDARIRSRNL